jgi:nitric oxide reductase NorQ protein
MILVKTSIEGANYKIQPLKYQKEIESLDYPLDEIRITAPIAEMAKSPLGTLFVVNKFTLPDPDHLHIEAEDMIPVEYSGTVFPLSGITNIQEIGDYTINYMLEVNPSEYDKESVHDLAKQLNSYGYSFDWEELTAPKPIDLEAPASSGNNLKRSIASKYPAPSLEDCGFYVDPDVWFLLVRNVLRGENTLLTGPSGTGKTELIEHVAKVMGKELSTQDMGTIFDAQSSLLGVHRIGKDGHSDFEYAPFVGHVQQGGIVLLDELNRSTLAANNILFPCLDRRRYVPVDIACEDCGRNIPVHEDTSFIATANIGAEYSGTQAIDRALLDRFFPIELDYLREEEEVSVLMKRTGVDERVASSIVKVANEVRKQAKEQELSNAISIRHNLQVASLVTDGFDVDKALMSTIMPLFQDGIGVSERSKVMSIISAF